MKIVVSIPTMGRAERPDQVRECVRRLLESVRDVPHEVIAVVHVDGDEATASSLADLPIERIVSSERKGAIVGWNAAVRHVPDADAYVLAADDVLFHDGWLGEALAALERLPNADGVVGLNDLGVGNRYRDFAPHYLMTRGFMARYHGGVLAIPAYQHYACDMETSERAQWAGRFVYADKAIVEHVACYEGKAPVDEVYRTADSTRAADRLLFLRRRQGNFPDDFERILPAQPDPAVFWCVPAVPAFLEPAVSSLLDVSEEAGRRGFVRLSGPRAHVDTARNCYADAFRRLSNDPDDMLVMLDADHAHPRGILQDLCGTGFGGVLAALCFRRGRPYDAMAWQMHAHDTDLVTDYAESGNTDGESESVSIAAWDPGTGRVEPNVRFEPGEIVKADALGMGAVMTRRWVFEQLEKAGIPIPHFRRVYSVGSLALHSEDMFFSAACRKAGVQMACHTGVVSPHIDWGYVGRNSG